MRRKRPEMTAPHAKEEKGFETGRFKRVSDVMRKGAKLMAESTSRPRPNAFDASFFERGGLTNGVKDKRPSGPCKHHVCDLRGITIVANDQTAGSVQFNYSV